MGQMMRGDRAISVMGKEGNRRLLLLSPLDLQGDFDCKISVMDDSMLRQEKRAEEQAKFQTAVNASQVMPLNLKAFMEDFLKSYGVQDTEKYFAHGPGTQGAAASPAAAGSPSGGVGTPPSPVAQPAQSVPGNPAGMTAPPGGGLSMSPDTFAQSQLAQVGKTQ
jgi:hypothetical protein